MNMFFYEQTVYERGTKMPKVFSDRWFSHVDFMLQCQGERYFPMGWVNKISFVQ